MAFDEVMAALQAYEKWCVDVGCTAVRRLSPGLRESDAQRIAGEYGVGLTEDALAVWMWHDGDGVLRHRPPFPGGYNEPGGVFTPYGFPSLRAAFEITAGMVAFTEWTSIAQTGVPGLFFIRDYEDDPHDYLPLDGAGCGIRLWHVAFMTHVDDPWYTIDCMDSGIRDSVVMQEETVGLLNPVDTVAHWIGAFHENMARGVADGTMVVDPYGEFRSVPHGKGAAA